MTNTPLNDFIDLMTPLNFCYRCTNCKFPVCEKVECRSIADTNGLLNVNNNILHTSKECVLLACSDLGSSIIDYEQDNMTFAAIFVYRM